MKRFTRDILLIALVGLCVEASAQRAYDQGAHAGLCFAGNGLHWSAHDVETKPGFTLGGEYLFHLDSLNLHFIAEGHLDMLLFDRDYGMIGPEIKETDMSYTNFYLSFPLLARYYFGGQKNVYVEVGPFLSILAFAHKSGTETSNYNDTGRVQTQDISSVAYSDFPVFGFGIALGAGYIYQWNENLDLVINVRNNAGLFSVSSVNLSIGVRKILK